MVAGPNQGVTAAGHIHVGQALCLHGDKGDAIVLHRLRLLSARQQQKQESQE
jgi:hypothetical protein